MFARRQVFFRRCRLFTQKDLGAWNRLEVAISLALSVLRLGKDEIENVTLELDSSKEFRVGAGATVLSSSRFGAIYPFFVVEEAGDEKVLAAREVLLDALDDDGHFEDLLGIGPLLGGDL